MTDDDPKERFEERLAEVDRLVDQHLEDLPRDREIVACCRGPYCLLPDEDVERLREEGYRARRLNGGYPDWRARGLPVDEVG